MDLCHTGTIRELLERHGFRFSKAMGQNFLIESSVPARIAEDAGLQGCGVLEIGPGIGCLTQHIASYAEKVVAVEVDKRLIPVLAETVGGLSNVEVVQGDILKLSIPALVSEKLAGLPLQVCANLPYNITTPVLSVLFESSLFERITVMIQREVAHRICAKPGTADYGAFTVYANYHTQPKILFDVSPDCFMPRPKVTSTVITMQRREHPPCPAPDEKMFFRVVRAAFSQRRKTLVNCLAGIAGEAFTKDELGLLLERQGLNRMVRGEALDIPQFAEIAAALKSALEGRDA